MMSLFSDRYKLGLILAVVFILGIGISLYAVFSLPSGLRLNAGYEGEFATVYWILATTFIVGGLTVLNAMRYKKEVIVFRDRAMEKTAGQTDTDQEGKTTISLENIISSLGEAKNEEDAAERALHSICKQLDVGQGALYKVTQKDDKRYVELQSGYALSIGESTVISYEFGEGLIGQAAASGSTLYIDDVPEGYVKIISGLGSASPQYVLIVSIKEADRVLGVIELASFTRINEDQRKFVEEASALIAKKISIKA